jgi:hypothetical protein
METKNNFFERMKEAGFEEDKVFMKINNNWMVWIKKDSNGKFIEMYGRNFR